MCILDRYIIKNFIIPFLYCLALFVFLYIIIDLFGHLDEILKQGVPLLMLQEYYLSMSPYIIIHTAPIAALISTIYVIGAMNKYDELTAMRAAGLNIFRILLPFIFIGIAISITIFLISEEVLPLSMKNAQYVKENYIEKDKKITEKIQKPLNNIALYGKNDKLIFIEDLDANNNIAKGITMLQQDKHGNVSMKTNASQAKWAGGSWKFFDVLIYELDEKGLISGNPLFFKEKEINMESPKELLLKGSNYEFMSYRNLSNYIQNFSNASPDIIQRLRVDLYQKISLPFTSLVVILIGSAFAIRIKKRGRAAAIMGMGTGIIIGFLYYAFMATFIALGKGGILPAFISAYLANIIFGTIGIILIRN